jgi:hypothetical protein
MATCSQWRIVLAEAVTYPLGFGMTNERYEHSATLVAWSGANDRRW